MPGFIYCNHLRECRPGSSIDRPQCGTIRPTWGSRCCGQFRGTVGNHLHRRSCKLDWLLTTENDTNFLSADVSAMLPCLPPKRMKRNRVGMGTSVKLPANREQTLRSTEHNSKYSFIDSPPLCTSIHSQGRNRFLSFSPLLYSSPPPSDHPPL